MITLTTESLEWQTITRNQSEIIFKNIAYIRQRVFSKSHKYQAIRLAKECGSDKLQSMLVEHKLFFSVWLEKSTTSSNKKQPDPVSKKQKILQDKQMIEDHNNLDAFLDQKLGELGL